MTGNFICLPGMPMNKKNMIIVHFFNKIKAKKKQLVCVQTSPLLYATEIETTRLQAG